MDAHKFQSIDEYISLLPQELESVARQMRTILKEAVPQAEEIISYNMPAYKYQKVLFYFAIYKNHVGFYPTGLGIEAFKGQLGEYKFSKGAIQFPINDPLPKELIREIALYRYHQVTLPG